MKNNTSESIKISDKNAENTSMKLALTVILFSFTCLGALPAGAEGAEQLLTAADIPSTYGMNPTADTLWASCVGNSQDAAMICLEETSPYIKQAAAALGALQSLMKSTSNQNEACKKSNSTASLVGGLLTAFNSACGGLQLACNNSCANFVAKATEEKLRLCAQPGGVVACPMAEKFVSDGGLRKATCAGYSLQLVGAAMGLKDILSQVMQTKKGCEDKLQNTDCKKTPEDPKCVALAGCSKPENQTLAKCICLQEPGNPGCGNEGRSVAAGYNTATDTAAANGDFWGKNGTFSNDPNAAKNAGLDGASSGGGNSAGAGGGGGSGGSGFGMVGGKMAAAVGGTNTKDKLNTNILESFDGGGGGGSSKVSGGYGTASNFDAYKNAMMPAAVRTPSAAEQFSQLGVSTSGGPSNFAKISDAYANTAPTLGGP